MMRNVLFKPPRSVNVVVIRVIADDDIGASYNILDIAYAFYCFIWIKGVRVGTILHIRYLLKMGFYNSYSIILSQFMTSSDMTVPFTAMPGSIIDFGHSFAISFAIWPNPPPPCVQKGIIVLPVKSFSLRKLITGGAKVLNQLGDPINTVS